MQIKNPLDVVSAVPYRRLAADQAASASTSFGGLPGATNFVDAQRAVKGAGNALKLMQIGLSLAGGLLVLTGIGTAIFSSFVNGAISVGIGISVISSAFRVLPQFMSQVGEAQATIGDLAAKAQVAQTGIPAMARVMSMQPTGTTVNGGPQVQAGLEVQGPNGPYLVHTMAVINPMYIPQFQPGSTVTVRVNPQNPQDIAVVF